MKITTLNRPFDDSAWQHALDATHVQLVEVEMIWDDTNDCDATFGSLTKEPIYRMEDNFGWDDIGLLSDGRLYIENRNCGVYEVSKVPVNATLVRAVLDEYFAVGYDIREEQ